MSAQASGSAWGKLFEIYCDNPDFDWRKDALTMIEPLELGDNA